MRTDIIIWSIVVIFLVYIIYQNLKLQDFYIYKDTGIIDNNGNEITPGVVTPCNYSLMTLPDISNDCCQVGGQLTGDRLQTYKDDNGFSHNFIISSESYSYSIVCANACIQGVINGSCVGGIGQTDYDTCINILKPKNCGGYDEIPIAKKDTTFWYAKSWNTASCPFTKTCPNTI